MNINISKPLRYMIKTLLFTRVLFFVSFGFLVFVSALTLRHFGVEPAPFIEQQLLTVESVVSGKLGSQESLRENQDILPPRVDDVQVAIEEALNQAKVTGNNQFNQYTLMTIYFSDSVYLINVAGKLVHRWSISATKGKIHDMAGNEFHIGRGTHINRAYLFPNGDVLAELIAYNKTPYGRALVKLDKDSNVLWVYNKSAVHHYFHLDKSNGNIFLLTQEFIQKKPSKLYDGLYFPMLVDYVTILSPEGQEIKKISILDAFSKSDYRALLFKKWNNEKNREYWDHLHTNSVVPLESDTAKDFPSFAAGQLLISMRNLNAIAVLDVDKESIIWAAKGVWEGQHSAKFLKGGNILLFDNRGLNLRNNECSRVIEIDPASLAVKWEFNGLENNRFYSRIHGHVQRLENGNTLITESSKGRIFEVTWAGDIVWDYRLPPYSSKLRKTTTKNLDIYPIIVQAESYLGSELTFLNH